MNNDNNTALDGAAQRDMARQQNEHVDGAANASPSEILNSVARQDAAPNDMARQDVGQHEEASFDETVFRRSSYTLTVEQIMQRLDVEGVSKSKRTVQRYFQDGEIDGKRVRTSLGQRWLANELDAVRFIEDLKRKEALALFTSPVVGSGFPARPSTLSPSQATTAEPSPASEHARPAAEIVRLEERASQMSERLSAAQSEITYLRDQVKDANEHIRLWSDRAKELKDLLQAQAEANTPVLAALARSIEVQSDSRARRDAPRRDEDVISIG